MKRYPLQAVLDQRQAACGTARLALAEAVRALEEEERRLAEAERAREVVTRERTEAQRHLYDPDETGMLPLPLIERRTEGLHHVERRLAEASRALDERRAAVARAQGELEGRRLALVEADRERKAVETHREAWLEEQRREQTRREERQSEEVVLARYAARPAGEGGSETS